MSSARGPRARRDQPGGAEQPVDERAPRATIVRNISATIRSVKRAAVVLAVDRDDRQHDQVGEEERQHAGEADPARPQHRRERHVADRADEAEHGDERPDDHVLERAERAAGVLEEQAVEEAVAELAR